MQYYYKLCRRHSKLGVGTFYIFIILFFLGICWISSIILSPSITAVKKESSSLIFCIVLSANDRHLTSSRAIVYSWGKRCDRFFFVTRLQNTSIDLMILEAFEDTAHVTSSTVTQQTVDVLLHLQKDQSFSSYHWFLRATDDSFVIVPNLRRLIAQLETLENERSLACVGDVEEMYKKYDIRTTGSVMLFNRNALNRLFFADASNDHRQGTDLEGCLEKMVYDDEFVACLKKTGIDINPLNDNLILSQNLSTYRMDQRMQNIGCSPDTVAFRSSNETDMYKFDFLYHRLDASSKINT